MEFLLERKNMGVSEREEPHVPAAPQPARGEDGVTSCAENKMAETTFLIQHGARDTKESPGPA